MPTAAPAWAEERREVKAERIARTLTARGLSALDAARLSRTDVLDVYADAHVKPGTGTSWRMAVEMLAGSRRTRAACPTCKAGDPSGPAGPPRPYGHEGPCTH